LHLQSAVLRLHGYWTETMNLIDTYRQRAREHHGYRPGSPFRSRREAASSWSTLVSLVFINTLVARLDWSATTTAIVQIGNGLIFALAWLIWMGWGRHRYPLVEQRDRQNAGCLENRPRLYIDSTRVKTAVRIYALAIVGLAFFVTWLDWRPWISLSAWLFVIGTCSWIGWAVRRPIELRTGTPYRSSNTAPEA